MSVARHFPTVWKLRHVSPSKVFHTPLRDVLRGRLSGRLDLRRRVAASSLPLLVQEKVLRVTKRTRLWRLEKVDVADELIAHFADGLEGGETVERLIERFGDERAAARLIRRAKRRGRPVAWQVFRVARAVAAAAVAFYVIAALRVVLSSPSPSVNYVQELNRPISGVPASDLALPLYRRAILALRKSPDGTYFPHDRSPFTTRHWPAVREWVAKNESAIAQVRVAAAKPVLGFVLGPDGSARDSELWPNRPALMADVQSDPKAGPPLVDVLLPHLQDMRQLAMTLVADARLARERKEWTRNEEDIVAVVRMADQLHQSAGFTVTDLIALGIRHLALDALDQTLAEKGLDADAIGRMAHLIARPDRAADVIAIGNERKLFEDTIQRMYSDDGHGDGRITRNGILYASRTLAQQGAGTLWNDRRFGMLASAPVFTASRKELLRQLDELDAANREYLEAPAWSADSSKVNEILVRWAGTTDHTQFLRFWPLATQQGAAFSRFRGTADYYLGYRDGLLIGLALELYFQKNGHYPQVLDELVPNFLPRLPPDQATGGPPQYRLVDGKPLVYSVGTDRDDDGGRLETDRFGRPALSWYHTGGWNRAQELPPDGDWPLYPWPKLPEEDDIDREDLLNKTDTPHPQSADAP